MDKFKDIHTQCYLASGTKQSSRSNYAQQECNNMSHPEPFYHLNFSLRSNIANNKNAIKKNETWDMDLGLERNGFGFICLVLFVEMLKYEVRVSAPNINVDTYHWNPH